MPAVRDRDEFHSAEELQEAFPELEKDTRELIAALKAGLPSERVETLKNALEIPTYQLTELVGIPSSTLARRRQAGRLVKEESERIYRIADLLLHAAEVFGTLDRARRWLQKPQFALGGSTPLAFADTEPGVREVNDLLVRIEHGMPV